jgi:hypothetical protein
MKTEFVVSGFFAWDAPKADSDGRGGSVELIPQLLDDHAWPQIS